MLRNQRRPVGPKAGSNRPDNLEKIISTARSDAEMRQVGYRALSLKIHPWVCARCGRSFTQENLTELTVHHKDHNHNNNPADGSNWENLCVYCHDNEHSRYTDHQAAAGMNVEAEAPAQATYNPFANLKELLQKSQK
ncbi:MAG: HNH nuclease family protein [Magnetococcales bacterium]|nr:HNH nuclease family protein [Magnetococcales bacterium]